MMRRRRLLAGANRSGSSHSRPRTPAVARDLDDAIADPEGAAMTALVLIEAGDNAAPDAAAILGDNLIVGVYDDAGVVIGASG